MLCIYLPSLVPGNQWSVGKPDSKKNPLICSICQFPCHKFYPMVPFQAVRGVVTEEELGRDVLVRRASSTLLIGAISSGFPSPILNFLQDMAHPAARKFL